MGLARLRAFLAVAVAIVCSSAAPGLSDSQRKPTDPFEGTAAARVFIFVRTDCPVSNRYAPEIERLHEKFTKKNVAFFLVYPDRAETEASIEKHLREYGYHIPALRDPSRELVKRSRVTITPEAAVFNAAGRLVYHGRIDDRVVDFGKSRAEASKHDLEDAVEATLEGKPVAEASTHAIGCYIADLE